MPTPVPVTPTLLNPGQYYAASAASGLVAASGNSGNFSGPFLIEEQTLSYNYCRVPEALYASASYSLSSYAQTMTIGQTLLALQVWATYKRTKSYDTFDTASWIQNQRFKVLSVSADPYGNEYGSVSAGTFGPAGAVVTAQKYYNRKPWQSTDTEISKSADGFNFYMTDALASYILQVPNAANGGIQTMNDYMPFVTHSWLRGTSLDGARGTWANNLPGGPQGTLHPGSPNAVWDMGWLGQKIGGWGPDQDTVTDVYIVTDALGQMVKDSRLVRSGATGNVLNPHLNGYKENHDGFSDYRPERHTWV